MVSRRPSRVTGTPTAAKSPCAAQADPCCSRPTISFSTSCGSGTKPNKKHSGKRTDRETREPKQRTKAPTHDSTSATILIESFTSGGSEADHPLTKPATRTAVASKAEPVRTFGAIIGRRERHSRKIRAALMGRIRSMWVHASSRSASAKVSTKECHPTSKETAHRMANLRCGGNLVMDASVVCQRQMNSGEGIGNLASPSRQICKSLETNHFLASFCKNTSFPLPACRESYNLII